MEVMSYIDDASYVSSLQDVSYVSCLHGVQLSNRHTYTHTHTHTNTHTHSGVPEAYDATMLGATVLAHMADHMAHRADGAVAHGKEMLARLLAFAPTTYLDWPDASAFRFSPQPFTRSPNPVTLVPKS